MGLIMTSMVVKATTRAGQVLEKASCRFVPPFPGASPPSFSPPKDGRPCAAIFLRPLRAGSRRLDGVKRGRGADEHARFSEAAEGEIGDRLGHKDLAKPLPTGRVAVDAITSRDPQ